MLETVVEEANKAGMMESGYNLPNTQLGPDGLGPRNERYQGFGASLPKLKPGQLVLGASHPSPTPLNESLANILIANQGQTISCMAEICSQSEIARLVKVVFFIGVQATELLLPSRSIARLRAASKDSLSRRRTEQINDLRDSSTSSSANSSATPFSSAYIHFSVRNNLFRRIAFRNQA
ncbi:hypothetical protein Nepgr_008787 [Nepenthes gracilis]|uniref:Uncharacterized protein n=1 Tax=Nepenthes gracilis TaxID=150966 RepID=A0AAD3SA37_NEPGR|nr:hypothetical protein Nepgr_008787 [Nepenthes gracilis]